MGELSAKFNTSIKLDKLSDFNSTMLDLYIEPAENRLQLYPSYNISNLNFTWEPIKFERNTLNIQINWTNPAYISPLAKQDKLIWFLKDGH